MKKAICSFISNNLFLMLWAVVICLDIADTVASVHSGKTGVVFSTLKIFGYALFLAADITWMNVRISAKDRASAAMPPLFTLVTVEASVVLLTAAIIISVFEAQAAARMTDLYASLAALVMLTVLGTIIAILIFWEAKKALFQRTSGDSTEKNIENAEVAAKPEPQAAAQTGIVRARYKADYDGGHCILGWCKVNLSTHEVFDIDLSETVSTNNPLDIDLVEAEYVYIKAKRHPLILEKDRKLFPDNGDIFWHGDSPYFADYTKRD